MVTTGSMLSLLPFLYEGKGQRVCDVHIYFPDDKEEMIEESLEACVFSGYAEKTTFKGEVFYFRKI